MDYTYEVITYGGGEALTLLFNGIVTAIGDSNYTTLIRLSGLLGLAWVLLESTFRQNLALNAKWFISFVLIYNTLLVPKVTLHIIDRLQHSQMHAVANTPWGLALFASLASQVGDTVTRLVEKNLALPDDLQYSQTGTLMAAQLIKSAHQFTLTDAAFALNIQHYLRQCVFYDVLLGKYSLQDLLSTNDLWRLMTQNASPARSFPYRAAHQELSIQTCAEGAKLLTHDWHNELAQAELIYGQRLFTTAPDARAALLKYLPISVEYLTGLSEQASQLLQQNMLASAIQHSLVGQAAELNAPAALQAYAINRAQDNQRGLYQITGELAARWLPLMKNVFEALFYGAFLILFPLMLLPFGASILKSYILALFWLESWAPLYAVLNLIMTLDARSHSLAAVTQLGGKALSLATLSGLAQVNADTAALAGYLSMSIPFIAYGIVNSGAHTLSHIASSLAGTAQSNATTASNEAGTGNMSFANTSFSTHSANNTSAHHVNTNASLESGLFSYQTASGAMIHRTPSGSAVVDNRGTTLSNIGTKINLADALRASAGEHYEQSITHANNQMQAYAQSSSAALRSMYDLAVSQGQHQGNDTTTGVNLSGGIQQSLQQVKELTDRFASEQGLSTSQAVRVLGEANASAGIGTRAGILNLGARVSTNIQGLSDAQHQQALRAGHDFVQSSRFSEATESALRGFQESHVKTGNDASQRLVNSLQSASEKADSYRQEASSSLQQAEGYRHLVNQVSEKALAINSDLSQAFVGSLQEKLGVKNAEYLLNHEPLTAQAYANQFAEHYVAGQVQQWVQEQGLGNGDSVRRGYSNSASTQAEQALKHVEQEHQGQITQHAEPYNLNAQQIDTSAQQRAAEIIRDSSTQAIIGSEVITNQGGYQQAGVEIDANPDNHDLASRALHGAKAAIKSTVLDSK